MSHSQNEIAELLAAERLWTAAHLQGDVATIDHIMADDYVRIQPDGSVADKAAVLATFLPDRRHWNRAQAARTTCASTATRRLPSDAVSTACIPFVRAGLVRCGSAPILLSWCQCLSCSSAAPFSMETIYDAMESHR